ncbi:hypothetical protein AX15_007735 [Amanita polypyramis BW_CC]|nr:hypothetical protein AX15_007735 [Amanita polypyramis BW_CC]
MASNSRPLLVLQPSVSTTRVVTTTTTTTTYAPIPLPPLQPPSSPKDPKQYPLLNATLPTSLRQFPLVFPGGARATFRDGDTGHDEMQEDQEVARGKGWRMLKRDEDIEGSPVVGLVDAIERYGKKRSHVEDTMMEGVESTTGTGTAAPPRKKARATHLPQINTHNVNAAAPPSPLPSPHGSPLPENIWPSAPPSGPSSPQPQAPLQPDLALTTLLTLPSLLSHFTALPAPLQSHVLLTLLRYSPLPVLRTLHSVLTPTLARDFITLLPPEIVSQILSYLPVSALARASRVSKSWRLIIDSDVVLWRDLLKNTDIWFGGESEQAFANSLYARRRHLNNQIPSSLPLPHPFKMLFKSRHLTRNRWVSNPRPKQISFPAHGSSVVTCLIFSRGRIISASDDHSIHVYSPFTGELIRSLEGHEGGVWALAASKDTLVSGSTDRTVRIWNLNTGKCTHVFGGHTSTVRCLAIVKPEMVEVEHADGSVTKEKWPKRPLIVTGSRDHSLRVWTLPKSDDPEYKSFSTEEGEVDPSDACDVDENPYHRFHLPGHDHAVRALAARGRTLVSGSYDCAVRVWDIITGTCKHVLTGHTQKVYSVVLDPTRQQACSGSMDGTVRVWNLRTGACQHVLTGHTSLVGLLGLSPSHLVSAAADSTLRIWDPDTGKLKHTLAAHTGAITCFQHDEFKVLSGSDGNLKMWDIREGTVVRDLLTGITGVWQVVFEGRWCVAASNTGEATMLDVWDFGTEKDDDWIGEPPGGMYDDDWFSGDGDGDDDQEADLRIRRYAGTTKDASKQVDVDAMDQDSSLPYDSEIDVDVEGQLDATSELADGLERFNVVMREQPAGVSNDNNSGFTKDWSADGVESSRWSSQGTGPATMSRSTSTESGRHTRGSSVGPSTSSAVMPDPPNVRFPLPRNIMTSEETPTRPRIRGASSRRR